MLKGSCHCGAITFTCSAEPEWLTQCNCSICRRYAALWAHSDTDQITVSGVPDASLKYVWGDEKLAFHVCKKCGCLTHWESLSSEEPKRLAINCRMSEPQQVDQFRVRHFDGADTWRYLD